MLALSALVICDPGVGEFLSAKVIYYQPCSETTKMHRDKVVENFFL